MTIYRSIVHPTTGKSPTELLFNRKMRGKLYLNWLKCTQISDRDPSCMQTDTRRGAQESEVSVGDTVAYSWDKTVLHHIQRNTTQNHQQDRKQSGRRIANKSTICEKHHLCQEIRRKWTETRNISRKGGNTRSRGHRYQRGNRSARAPTHATDIQSPQTERDCHTNTGSHAKQAGGCKVYPEIELGSPVWQTGFSIAMLRGDFWHSDAEKRTGSV